MTRAGAAALVALLAACSSFGVTAASSDAGAPPTADGGVDDAVAVDAGSAYAEAVLFDHPLAYFRLAERSGDAVNLGSVPSIALAYGDGVERGVTGLLHGDSDLAVHLDGQGGVGKVLTAAQNVGLEPSSAISIECWLKRDGDSVGLGTAPSVFEYLVSYDQEPDVPFQSYVMQLNGSQPGMHLGSIDNNNTTAFPVLNGQAYHLVVTYDGVDEVIYVNGAPIKTEAHTGPLHYDGKRGLDVGGDSVYQTAVFNGTIDEVAIYDTALIYGRVLAHYEAGQGH